MYVFETYIFPSVLRRTKRLENLMNKLGSTTKRILWAVIGTATVALSLMVGHNVDVYDGQNVGVTWGNVGGYEIVGQPGFFANNDK